MRHYLLQVVCAFLLLVVAACGLPEPDMPPATPSTSPSTTDNTPKGDITGFVTLCDEFGVVKPKSDSMIVSLEGLQTAFPVRTRPEGRFVILNAFAGKYNLSYNKSGYGNFKQTGITHSGGSSPTVVSPVLIWERATTVPSNLTVAISGLNLTLLGLTTPVQPAGTPEKDQRRVRLFFGRDETVSHLNYVSTLEQTLVPPGGTGAFAYKLLADDLLAFKPGERVYAIAYGITGIENAYDDPDTKRKVYTGINPTPSNRVSFVLP